ncbi:hypothetical protein ABFA25_02095 [Mycobacterium lepromatosis]
MSGLARENITSAALVGTWRPGGCTALLHQAATRSMPGICGTG